MLHFVLSHVLIGIRLLEEMVEVKLMELEMVNNSEN